MNILHSRGWRQPWTA